MTTIPTEPEEEKIQDVIIERKVTPAEWQQILKETTVGEYENYSQRAFEIATEEVAKRIGQFETAATHGSQCGAMFEVSILTCQGDEYAEYFVQISF